MAQDFYNNFFEAVGEHSQDSSLDTVLILTRPANASKIWLQALTQNIRFTIDGSTPTSSKGFQLEVGKFIVFPFSGNTIKIIEETASASVEYQWLR